jgi:hypothetical protein
MMMKISLIIVSALSLIMCADASVAEPSAQGKEYRLSEFSKQFFW